MKDEENEIVQEDFDPKGKQASYGAGDSDEVVEEYQGDQIKKLKERLKECEGKAKEYLDGWQRAQAEFVNIRKRDEESKVEFLKFANVDLILQLMPVLDSLSLAGGHAEPIYKQMLQILKQSGVEEINPIGEMFDPKKHEAISTKAGEDHKILEVMQKGYILHGKIIRPAKVTIGHNG